MGFSDRLKKFRLRLKLSQKEAAKLIGVPESTYRDWEYGRAIQGEPYLKIAEVFGVSIASLFGDEDSNLPIEQRLNRIKRDVELIQAELSKLKK